MGNIDPRTNLPHMVGFYEECGECCATVRAGESMVRHMRWHRELDASIDGDE